MDSKGARADETTMMYFGAKSDLAFITTFRSNVLQLLCVERDSAEQVQWEFHGDEERQLVIQKYMSKDVETEYKTVRETIACGMDQAIEIARSLGIPIDWQSCPAPAVGGPIIPVNVFRAILHDTSHGGIAPQRIEDTLNQVIGAAERRVRAEFRQLWNPFYWMRQGLVFTIRIPFELVKLSGFNVSKVEDHLFGRLFKLIESLALVCLVTYFLLRLGFSRDQIVQFFSGLIPDAHSQLR